MRARTYSAASGAVVAAIGTVVLAGWALDLGALKGLLPGFATMKANTALGFALLGGALWLQARGTAPAAARALAAAILALGALSLSQDLWSWNAGIDELLFRDADAEPPVPPGRPSPATALMFVLLGASLLLLPHAPSVAQGFALVAAALALLSLLGYLFGAPGLYRVWIFSSVALHTALSFALAATGLLAARPRSGWLRELARDTPGARMGRRLFGVVLLGLPTVAWLRFKGQEWGWYGIEVGLGIVVLASTALLGAAIFWSVRALNAIQAQRDAAQAEQARFAERLRLLRSIDSAILEEHAPALIAEAALRPLRELLQVPRAIVNLFSVETGEAEWLAGVGRQRAHVGPGVRFPLALMGDLDGLRRGEPQTIATDALPPGAHKAALLDSGVRHYMALPMIASGELIGALSFGGETAEFPADKVSIALEVASQLAIAVSHARLHDKVRAHAAELERRVAERTQELAAANRELEAFSYSVSHDLRAPLRAIDGFTHMLEEDYGERLDGEGRRLLAVVRDSSRAMGRLIDDLLSFSRLVREPLTLQDVDMGKLVAEAIEELRREWPREVEIGGLPAARADPRLLRQAWLNLVANAFKYSSKRELPEVRVGGSTNGNEHVYWVRDNGAGFDMRYADKLFRVFQRLHKEEQFPGTGVGLAIVQRVIERHGGRVWAEGAPDQGACFYFALPRET